MEEKITFILLEGGVLRCSEGILEGEMVLVVGLVLRGYCCTAVGVMPRIACCNSFNTLTERSDLIYSFPDYFPL